MTPEKDFWTGVKSDDDHRAISMDSKKKLDLHGLQREENANLKASWITPEQPLTGRRKTASCY